jgi:DNA-binding NarL/FixJ family response regulator
VISEKTVATHVQRIMTKLGVHSRAAAVAKAHREGLATADVEAHRLFFAV